LLAKLHARWEREDEIARNLKIYTTTTSNDIAPNASNPLTLIGVEKTPTPCVKRRINDVLIMVNNNLVPFDFPVMDVECYASCPIIVGRPFLRTIGAIIDMREDTIKYQFPLKKGMEHFPRKRKKLLFDSIIRGNYELDASSLDVT
jgi:hypothetical protein